MRPSLAGTVFPVLAFAVGIAVGAYLPPGILPGTGPTKPDGSPKDPPPSPAQALEQLWNEITTGLGKSNDGSGATANAGSGNAATNSGSNASGSGNTAAQPGDPMTPEAMAAEKARQRQAALALNRQPMLMVGVVDGRTLVVQAPDGSRRQVVMAAIDRADPDIAKQLERFVGQRVSLDLAKDVINDAGQIVAVVHILPLTWTPADGPPTDDRLSLNNAIYKALKK